MANDCKVTLCLLPRAHAMVGGSRLVGDVGEGQTRALIGWPLVAAFPSDLARFSICFVLIYSFCHCQTFSPIGFLEGSSLCERDVILEGWGKFRFAGFPLARPARFRFRGRWFVAHPGILSWGVPGRYFRGGARVPSVQGGSDAAVFTLRRAHSSALRP